MRYQRPAINKKINKKKKKKAKYNNIESILSDGK